MTKLLQGQSPGAILANPVISTEAAADTLYSVRRDECKA